MKMRNLSLLIAFLFFQSIAYSSNVYEPVYAKQGMVAGPEPYAVQAGVEILKNGGNAFDAAAAVGFALAVTYPAAGNLGGGGFMTAAIENSEILFLDFRETAPLAASPDMYLDREGNILPDASTKTLLAVGVPGTVHGLFTMLDDHGTMSRSEILRPAIQLAESGFPVSYSLHRSLHSHSKTLSSFPSTKTFFIPAVLFPNSMLFSNNRISPGR